MSQEGTGIKLLTTQEANAILPHVRRSLGRLRDLKSKLLRDQAQAEIEQMTGSDGEGNLLPETRKAVAAILERLSCNARAFEQELEALAALGAQLKDLDQGLVDFYSRRGGEVVFLCWREGEDKVAHWHTLEAGFRGRRPL